MLSQKFVFPRSKNFTSDAEVRTAPSVPIDPVRPRPNWGLPRRVGEPNSDTVTWITPSRVKNQQKESRESIPCYSMLEHSGGGLLWTRWFVHSNIGRRPVCIWWMRRRFRTPWRVLLTGNRFGLLERTVWRKGLIRHRDCNRSHARKWGHLALSDSWSNYELFNSSSINIRYWCWNYRGCWHQTCPPIDTHRQV